MDVNVDMVVSHPVFRTCCCSLCVNAYVAELEAIPEREDMNIEFKARKCVCCGREELRAQFGTRQKILDAHWWCLRLFCQLHRVWFVLAERGRSHTW